MKLTAIRMAVSLSLFSALLAACAAAPTAAPTVAAAPTPTPAPTSAPVTVTITPATEIGQNPDYTLTTEMPSLQGVPDAQAEAFASAVAAVVQAQAADFKKSVQENAATAVAAGLSGGSYFDQRVGLVSAVGDLVSVKLVTEAFVAASAHPYHLSTSYTFDLASGQALTLDQLFLPGSSYLQTIATYCKARLVANGWATDVFAQGADPTAANYSVWNPTAAGLLITFNEYQVAPYAAGPQVVTVPYSEIKAVLDPLGPLAGFAH